MTRYGVIPNPNPDFSTLPAPPTYCGTLPVQLAVSHTHTQLGPAVDIGLASLRLD